MYSLLLTTRDAIMSVVVVVVIVIVSVGYGYQRSAWAELAGHEWESGTVGVISAPPQETFIVWHPHHLLIAPSQFDWSVVAAGGGVAVVVVVKGYVLVVASPDKFYKCGWVVVVEGVVGDHYSSPIHVLVVVSIVQWVDS